MVLEMAACNVVGGPLDGYDHVTNNMLTMLTYGMLCEPSDYFYVRMTQTLYRYQVMERITGSGTVEYKCKFDGILPYTTKCRPWVDLNTLTIHSTSWPF